MSNFFIYKRITLRDFMW